MNIPRADEIPGMTAAEIAAANKLVGTVKIDATTKAKEKTAFFVHGHNTTYIFKDGTKAHFVSGLIPGVANAAFITDKQGYIDELNAEIDAGHANFFRDPDYVAVTDETLDPLAKVKREAVEAYIAQQNAKRDMGSTENKPQLQGMGNSDGVSNAAAGGQISSTASLLERARSGGATVVTKA